MKNIICFLSFEFFALLLSSVSYGQCTGGASAGSLTPTASWQTASVMGGQYFTFTGNKGAQYTFSFCGNGGSTSFDSQITILDNSGAYSTGAFNDDYCGLSSYLTFVPISTATYRILVTEYNCIGNSTTATLAYQITVPDEPCSSISLNPSCSTTYGIYSTYASTSSSSVSNPSCAKYKGRDVWFKTVVPFSGSLVVSTQAQDITDAGMSIYSASSCAGPFSELSCNDNTIGNMPQISLSSLTPGDSLYIRVWAYNNLQVGSFGIYVNDPNPTYCMTGSAVQNYTTGCIQMTPDLPSQSACLWNDTRLDLSQAFSYNFSMNFGTKDANGADGITFVMQNAPAGMNALGSTGGDLGAVGIPNSVVVEFDTWDNGSGVNDIPDDHTAISLNGNVSSPVAGPVDASATSTNIEDGLNHTIRITWDPSTYLLSVYFDGSLRLTYTSDLINNVFGGSNLAYWGFTSSTGGYSNTQTICPGNLPGAPLPVNWELFSVSLIDDNPVLNWQTTQEKNINNFIVERSTDGISFSSIGNVAPSGQANGIGKYKFMDIDPFEGNSYYRIKEVDLDGKYTYSEIKNVSIKNSMKEFMIYPNPVNRSHEISIKFSGYSGTTTLMILNNTGQEILKVNVDSGISDLQLPSNLTPGIYQAFLISDSRIDKQKLTIAE